MVNLISFFSLLLICLQLFSQVVPVEDGRVYYIDSRNGNDQAAGNSPEAAWRSLEKVNRTVFQPGTRIRFKSDGVWTGTLAPQGSGEAGRPIVVERYGDGSRPRIAGEGAEATLLLENQQYWEINDLEITNYKAEEEGGISLEAWEAANIREYAEAELPAKAVKDNTPKLGIRIVAKDLGAVRHIHLKNLLVHGVNGTIVPDGADENGASKNNGGIGFEISGTRIPTWFEDIRVEGCTIRDVDRTGLFNRSSWDSRTFDKNTNWTPSQNIVIRNNTFQRTGANALIVRVAEDPLIEHNLFDRCAIKGSGNAAFSFNTDGAVWQFNECRFTKANVGDNDAGGIDSDYRSKNTVIQYNWLHDNDFGMLVTGGGGSFNDGTVVRYNIIERDGTKEHRSDRKKFIFKVSGGATNTHIYNNTIFTENGPDSTYLVFHKRWKVWPAHTVYTNNLFINESGQAGISLGGSEFNTFTSNKVEGHGVRELANVPGREISVKAVGTGPEGYRLKRRAATKGKIVPDNGGRDYLGKPVPRNKRPAIGASEEL